MIYIKSSKLCFRHHHEPGLLSLYSTGGICIHIQSSGSKPPLVYVRWVQMIHSYLYSLSLSPTQTITVSNCLAASLKPLVLGVCQTCVVQRWHTPLSQECHLVAENSPEYPESHDHLERVPRYVSRNVLRYVTISEGLTRIMGTFLGHHLTLAIA